MKNFLAGYLTRRKAANDSGNISKEKEDDIYALQRSEIIDEHTCNLCLSMDVLVLATDDKIASVDLCHEGCRGIWVEIMKEEPDPPPVTGVPDELRRYLQRDV